MIAEGGLAALWLAAALSLLQLCFGVFALRPGGEVLLRTVRPVAAAQAVLVAIAFLCLILLFLRTDLSVALVAANSHAAKPWLYNFAGAWGILTGRWSSKRGRSGKSVYGRFSLGGPLLT